MKADKKLGYFIQEVVAGVQVKKGPRPIFLCALAGPANSRAA